MGYAIRDENGLLILRIGNADAKAIMDNAPGIFRPWKSRAKDAPKTVFEVTKPMTYTVGEIKIYLWEKTLLIPDTE